MTLPRKGRRTLALQLRPPHMKNILADPKITGHPSHTPPRLQAQANRLPLELPVIPPTLPHPFVVSTKPGEGQVVTNLNRHLNTSGQEHMYSDWSLE